MAILFDGLGRVIFGQHFHGIDVYFNFKVNVDIIDGHTIRKGNTRLFCWYELLHRNDLGLQHLNAVSYETNKIKHSLFIA